MAKKIHLYPFRTQKLSSYTPKVLGWGRPGRIGSCRILIKGTLSNESSFLINCSQIKHFKALYASIPKKIVVNLIINKMNRTEARDMAFKFLYQVEVQKENNEEALNLFFENNEIENKDAKKYILDIANGVAHNLENIIELIKKNLKQDWKIERISKVTLAILKLAIYEIVYAKIPFKVVINEAVELAKKYGEETAPAFVNGILASVVKENI